MDNLKLATFGAGCFWGVEEAFRTLPGVIKTTVGYTGGKIKNPTYEQVCSGTTGHTEVLQLKYDPKKISYQELLKKFWEIHDPTQMNRQGPDVGEQYRSVIFFHDQEQEKIAKESLENEQKKINKKIATAIELAPEFYKAEEYHQKYILKTGKKVC